MRATQVERCAPSSPLGSLLQCPVRPAGGARALSPGAPRVGGASRLWAGRTTLAALAPHGPLMAAPEEPLRRRKAGGPAPGPGAPSSPGRDPAGCPARLRAGTFWLTRVVILKALAFVYCESRGPAPRQCSPSARTRHPRVDPVPLRSARPLPAGTCGVSVLGGDVAPAPLCAPSQPGD